MRGHFLEISLTRRFDRIPAATLAAAAMLLSLTAGAGSSAPQDEALQHQVGVSFKLIQVYVTGKGGQPVGDLTAEDFEVTDNGKPQTVTHFEKRFLGAEEPSERPAAPLSTNRKFFLIFDFAFMDARSVVRSKEAALAFLDTEMLPTDEIGLVTYSTSRGLVLHEYLTTDHPRVRAIVEGFGMKHYAGRAENLTDFVYSADLAEIQELGDSGAEGRFYENQARLQTGQLIDQGRGQGYAEQARQFVTSLRQLAKVFRMIPGFKNVILFSGGIARQLIYGKTGGAVVSEWSTPEQLAAQLSSYDAAQADSGLRNEFTEMLKDLRASNSPVYSIDVSRSLRESDATTVVSVGPGVREIEGTDSLKQIASGTGGKFFANTVDNDRVAAEIRTITGAYYVLGYDVDEKWDGKFHKIKVKVRRKGLRVVTQGGYFGAKPFNDYTGFEKLLHVVDLALSDTPQVQVPFEVPVSGMPVLVKGWPKLLVFGRASLSVHTEVLGKRSEAFLLLFDEKGDMAAIKKFRLAIPETGKETLIPSFLMTVKPGAYTCRLVLRNMETGRGARGMVPLDIPAAAAGGLSLDPPLLLVPASGSLDLAASPEGSLAEIYGYDPNAYEPLIGQAPAGLKSVVAALRLSGYTIGAEIEVTASLTDGSSSVRAEVPVSILKEEGDRYGKTFLVEVALDGPHAGEHLLEFKARDGSSGAEAAASVALTVK
jgi:VWFA-related protein